MPKRASKTPPAINGHALNFRGDAEFGDAFVRAIEGLEEEAELIGYPGIDSREIVTRMKVLPEGWGQVYQGPTMSAYHIFRPMVEIVILLREPITKALVQVASGEFFKMVFPKIGKIFTKKEGGAGENQYPIIFRPAMYFESEQVLVTALMTVRTPGDYKCAETLVPQAFERAIDWLERNGRQAPYLTYRIEDCKLNSFPSISHEPPSN